MSVGESQACNCIINGSMRRFFSDFFSYAFREVAKMACNLEEAVGVVLGMVAAGRELGLSV